MLLSIVIVNFQSQAFLKECLTSLEKNLKDIPFEVILVNNDLEPLKEELFSSFSFQPKVLQTQKNIGFGAGCNLAAQNASGKFIFFLNPDSFLLNDSLKNALDFLEKKSKVGILGGKIVLFPEKIIQAWTSGKSTSLFRIIFRHSLGATWKKNQPTQVDWVSGTALLVRKTVFEKVGGFDEKFFMYFEDQDLCLRIKKTGFQVFFFPGFLISHYNGKSWKDTALKKKSFYLSQDIFFQKHRPCWESYLLKLFRFIFKGQ